MRSLSSGDGIIVLDWESAVILLVTSNQNIAGSTRSYGLGMY